MNTTIETERLVLFPLHEMENQYVLDFHKRNEEHLRPWEPERPANFLEEKSFKERQERAFEQAREGKAFRWYVTKKGEPTRVIGSINVTNIVPSPLLSGNLGYSMDITEQKKGYTTEGVIAVAERVKHDHGMHRLEAGYMPQNTSSARVLAKAGFEIIGIAKKYLLIHGKWEDHVLTQKILEG